MPFLVIVFFAVLYMLTQRLAITESQKTITLYKNMLLEGMNQLNNIMREGQKIIAQNRGYFISDEDIGDPDLYLNAVNDVSEIKIANTYVTDVVFYRFDNDILITQLGTIEKELFFNYSYQDEKYDLAFWEALMKNYQAPTIIPVDDYVKVQNGEKRRIFVVPKIYPIYKTGILIFVDENAFLDALGLQADKADLTVYDKEGTPIIRAENAKSLSKEKLVNLPKYTMNIFGKYDSIVGLGYEGLLIKSEKNNFQIGYVLIFAILALFSTLIYQKRQKNALIEHGRDAQLLKDITINAAMRDGGFHLLHGEMERVIDRDSKWSLLIIITYSASSENLPKIEQIRNLLPDNMYFVSFSSSRIILYTNIFLEYADGKEYAEKSLQHLKGYLTNFGEMDIWTSRPFKSIQSLHNIFCELKCSISSDKMHNAEVILNPSKLDVELRKSIYEGKLEEVSELVKSAIHRGEDLSNNLFSFYATGIYFQIVRAVSKSDEFYLDTFDVFSLALERYQDEYNRSLLTNVLYATCKQLDEYTDKVVIKNSIDIEALKKFIKDNLKNGVYIEQAAENLGMDLKDFSYQFKKQMGIPFSEFLISMRMEEGKHLLIESNDKIQEIALLAGYSTVAAFNIAFKKNYGMTPSQFQKSYKNQKVETRNDQKGEY
jgi:AraC-like DNA-binding protein